MLLAWHASALIPRTSPVFFGVAAQVEGRLYKRDVAERLWHVADQPAVARIVFFTCHMSSWLGLLAKALPIPYRAPSALRLASCAYYPM
jgi:hypothetical protein